MKQAHKEVKAEDIGFAAEFKSGKGRGATFYAGGRANQGTIAIIAQGKVAETATKANGKTSRKAWIEGGRVLLAEPIKQNGENLFAQLMGLCSVFAEKMGYKSFKVKSGDGKGCKGYAAESPKAKSAIRVTSVSIHPANAGKTLAVANVCLNDELYLYGIEVRAAKSGELHIEFPGTDKGVEKKYFFFPALATGFLYQHIEAKVLAEYAKLFAEESK